MFRKDVGILPFLSCCNFFSVLPSPAPSSDTREGGGGEGAAQLCSQDIPDIQMPHFSDRLRWRGGGDGGGGVASRRVQSCKKIMILDLKDQDLFIDLDLLHDLDQFIDLLKLILIFDLRSPKLEIIL